MTILNAFLAWLASLGTPYPARDWALILLLATLLCIGHIAFAAYLFVGVQTGSILSGTTRIPEPPRAISREAIKLAIESYQVRAANYAAKNFTTVRVIDPRPPRARTQK